MWTALLHFLDPAVVFGSAGGAGLLGLVGAKFHKLETEVRECRKRDANVVILMAGVRMMVGEMRREIPDSHSLKVMGEIFGKAFGPPPSADELANLLHQVDIADDKRKDGHAKRTPGA